MSQATHSTGRKVASRAAPGLGRRRPDVTHRAAATEPKAAADRDGEVSE